METKKNILDLKKFIKEEPGIGKRLQSVRLPRDLSLGGTKLSKKQFVPNLNATRNKEKAKEFLKRNENKRIETRNVKRQKIIANDQRYVQSSGIFADGAGSDLVRTSRWSDKRSENDGSSGPPAMSMPTFKKNSYEIDIKNEDSVLDGFMGSEEDSEDENEKLPFQPILWHNQQHFQEVPIKKEIKNEPVDELVVTPNLNNLKLEPRDSYWGLREYIENDCFNNDNPSISLWKLPSSFAGKGLSDDPNCKTLTDYRLNEMLEGQIGKIVIRRSGKVEVQIGRIKYKLNQTNSEACREEIVSLEAKSETQVTAAVLGQVQNDYSLHTDWEILLKHLK